MMFTSSSQFVSKLLSGFFFFPFSCNGHNNNNNQVTKHRVVNTKQKSLSFFLLALMKALRLTQTTVGLVGQVPSH